MFERVGSYFRDRSDIRASRDACKLVDLVRLSRKNEDTEVASRAREAATKLSNKIIISDLNHLRKVGEKLELQLIENPDSAQAASDLMIGVCQARVSRAQSRRGS